jgi:hypothetical protein
MLQTNEYQLKLEKSLKEIKSHFDFAEIRESGVASFIFAEKENRAVEIYQSENAAIVEFWENEQQQTEKEVNSYEEATKLAVEWIKGL